MKTVSRISIKDYSKLDLPDFLFAQAAVEMAGSIGSETRTTPCWPVCGGTRRAYGFRNRK
jgi:hypothetical protein